MSRGFLLFVFGCWIVFFTSFLYFSLHLPGNLNIFLYIVVRILFMYNFGILVFLYLEGKENISG